MFKMTVRNILEKIGKDNFMGVLQKKQSQRGKKKYSKIHKKIEKYLLSIKVVRFNYSIQLFQTNLMVNGLSAQTSFFSKSGKTVFAGALASFLTQPFQVMKTNMIDSPTLYFKDLHGKIIKNGWTQYMRGGTIAVVRQGYGFTIYTTIIDFLNSSLSDLTHVNKYYRYSIAAGVGKTLAMMFEAPLTLLKTRLELISSDSLTKECLDIVKNPRQNFGKGLNATLARELVYSLLHYNSYRFLKDDILMAKFNIDSAFISAFFAGMIAITLSQPLDVIRSKVSTNKNLTMIECGRKIILEQGWKGYFTGYIPRLCRKPINSGICWTLLQTFKEGKKEQE